MKDRNLIRRELKTNCLESLGILGNGCISKGSAYVTDKGKIFIKENNKPKAKLMFKGELASLNAIIKTNTILTPKPIKLIENIDTNSIYLAMEYIEMKHSNNQAKLGTQLAKLHLYNSKIKDKDPQNYVANYGFSSPTCCGYIPQNNIWNSDWIDFFMEQRLQHQMDLFESQYKDSEVLDKWPILKRLIPSFFADLMIEPSLLHGDLWCGNIGETEEGEPVIFDPASFYGHHEYDLGITRVSGGFNASFYSAYHRLIPKSPGFDTRNKLYQLYHYLNNWNHYGSRYRSPALNIIDQFIK